MKYVFSIVLLGSMFVPFAAKADIAPSIAQQNARSNMQDLWFLLLTIAVELPIAMVCLRKEARSHALMTVLGVHMVSHPII